MKQLKIHLALAGIPTIGQRIDEHFNRNADRYVDAFGVAAILTALFVCAWL